MYDAGLSREAIFGRTCTTLVLKGLNFTIHNLFQDSYILSSSII